MLREHLTSSETTAIAPPGPALTYDSRVPSPPTALDGLKPTESIKSLSSTSPVPLCRSDELSASPDPVAPGVAVGSLSPPVSRREASLAASTHASDIENQTHSATSVTPTSFSAHVVTVIKPETPVETVQAQHQAQHQEPLRQHQEALQYVQAQAQAHVMPSHDIPAPATFASKPRSRSSVVPRLAVPARQKLRQASFGAEQASLKPLNTHSPVAMAAAAAVTPEKIRKLLIVQGPLPIRHITSHLAATIPGFGELSLSKQRRLIIAVLDGPKSDFVKVGWGRWAVDGYNGNDRKDSSLGAVGVPTDGTPGETPQSRSGNRNSKTIHRESISRQLPNSKPPLSPSLGPIEDSAVFSDTESSSELEDDSEVEGTDEEDWRAMGPSQLRQTSPREQDAIAALVQLRSN